MTTPLEAAHAIARDLAAQAIHHGGRCTWVGPVADPAPPHDVVRGTLDASLYAGLAGVGLTLAEIGAATGDATLRATAAAALRQAVAVAERTPPGPGLFDGTAGLALAAARAGALLGEEALVRAAWDAAGRLADADQNGWDLVSGRAGTVVALFALARQLEEPELANGARRVAAGLSDAANRSAAGLSWTSPSERWPGDLTGLSHGAAGGALALAEAGLAAEAADALRYEDSWFDRRLGTWRDVRALRSVPAPTTSVAWCHGAPGMVLARVRIAEIGGPPLGDAATAGLALLHRHLEASLDTVGANVCLCHGLCGLAETAALADPAGAGDAVPRAAAVVTGLLDDGVPLPCGIPGGHALGLMTGVAGVARFLLRAHDPAAAPSALLIRPREWAAPAPG